MWSKCDLFFPYSVLTSEKIVKPLYCFTWHPGSKCDFTEKKKIWIGSTETGLNIFKMVLSCYLVGVSLVLKKAFQGFVFSAIAFEFLWLLMFCANQSWSWIYLFKILGFQDWRIIHKPKILYFSAAFLFFYFFLIA